MIEMKAILRCDYCMRDLEIKVLAVKGNSGSYREYRSLPFMLSPGWIAIDECIIVCPDHRISIRDSVGLELEALPGR